MEKEKFSYPVSLRRMQITDKFWKNGTGAYGGDPLSVECVE